MPAKELLVVITGSRTWPEDRPAQIVAFMLGVVAAAGKRPVRFFVGDCPSGVDKIVLETANKHDLQCNIFVADWTKHGKAAGPIRNGEMISRGPDLVQAFRVRGDSPGTDDCIRQAVAAGHTAYVVSPAW